MFLENRVDEGRSKIDVSLPGLPIFVVGTPRSGTTLVSRILGNHPGVLSLGESNFFEDIWARREEIGTLQRACEVQLAVDRLMNLFARYHEPDTQELVDRAVDPENIIEATMVSSSGDYGTLYTVFMGALARFVGARHICDDTPKHLYYLQDIFEILPHAKVIICTRDVRDYLISYQNWWRRSPDSERIRALYHPILTSMLWRSSTNVALASLDKFTPEQVLLMRYEDLVDSPQSQVQKICSFLQLEYSDELLQLDNHNSSFENSSTGIFGSSVGRWRHRLSPEAVWWAQKIGYENMFRLGYEPVSIRPNYGRLVLDFVTLPTALAVAFRANRYHRGPTLAYLRRRIVPMRRM